MTIPPSMPDAKHFLAPAKVNLGLEILRRRPDGYHDLETIFYRIALADTIELYDRPSGLTMECNDQDLISGPDNLCLRAAHAMRTEGGIERGLHIVLHKKIPTGAGLGGGSSDAATVLRELNSRWSVGMSVERLKRIGATLGSDVPAFLGGPISFGTGRGEHLEELPSHFPYWLVCVTPPVSVSTSWAYRHLQLRTRPDRQPLRDRFLEALSDLDVLSDVLVNDFEDSVLQVHPEILEVKKTLKKSGCRVVLMSGSGSSVFGLTDDRAVAESAVRAFDTPMVVSITPPLA